MVKKILMSTVMLGLVFAAGTASAQYCNGTVVPDNDCDSNTTRSYSTSCCPDGYRAHGVAYNDMAKSDYADAISPVCRHVIKGNDMMPTDFQTAPVIHKCDKTEVMSGIACKDMPKNGGINSDILDGCTAICFNPKTRQTRTLYSKDLEENGRSYVRHTIDLPNRIFGIAYKDIGQKKSSDRADCATIVYRNEPIVGGGKAK